MRVTAGCGGSAAAGGGDDADIDARAVSIAADAISAPSAASIARRVLDWASVIGSAAALLLFLALSFPSSLPAARLPARARWGVPPAEGGCIALYSV